MINAHEHIQFENRDWQVIKAWLLEKKERKIGLLIQAKDNDESNKIRGSLGFIQEILALETAATQAARG